MGKAIMSSAFFFFLKLRGKKIICPLNQAVPKNDFFLDLILQDAASIQRRYSHFTIIR